MTEVWTELEATRRQLGALYDAGPAAKADVDRVTRQEGSNQLDDLRTAFSEIPGVTLDGLRLLNNKLDTGDLIRRAYHRRDQGCLFNILLGVRNNSEALAIDYPNVQVLLALARVTLAWDDGSLSEDAVRDVLEDVIREREELNAIEDALVQRVAQATRSSRPISRQRAAP